MHLPGSNILAYWEHFLHKGHWVEVTGFQLVNQHVETVLPRPRPRPRPESAG